jgi:hypothetical protein
MFPADSKLLSNPVKALIVPGDMRAGNVFPQSVHTLVEETIPSVSEPPGNSVEFQARAAFLFCVEKPLGFFYAL